MSLWSEHLIITPVALPLCVAAVMLLLGEQRRTLKAAINILAVTALLAVAIILLVAADSPANGSDRLGIYLLGNWQAPFGIVLVVDRLSALMLVLASVLALASLLFSLARWHRAGAHFHPLFQLLLMGVNGAFLTGDLFNLFVFFEVLLAASYGLVLHGSGALRVKAGLHYVTVNLAASLLFLVGVSLIYAATGTLNMADLSARISSAAAGESALLQAGAALLGIAFLVKAGVWPLCFWLPATYPVVAPPVAALFAIMTKVGVYVILRTWLLLFGADAGASAQFGRAWLMFGGIATVAFASIGALASPDLARLAAFTVLMSAGTLLAVISVGDPGVTAGALFYLVSSSFAIGALFLLIELVERGRVAGGDLPPRTVEAFEEEEDGQQVVGIAIPTTMAILGLSFACCAVLLAGLPPLAGFIAKFLILEALLRPARALSVDATTWTLLALLLLSGLVLMLAMTRTGIQVFWAPVELAVTAVRAVEMAPIAVLLLLSLMLTIWAGPVMRYMQSTALSLHDPQNYVRSVLSAAAVKSARSGGAP